MTTKVKAVRDALPSGSRERSTTAGIAYFAVAAAMYGGSFAAMGTVHEFVARVGLALVNGVAIAVLFVVGHDACHGSLTPRTSPNRWIGRIAFLPSLHPFSSWEYSHNGLHHGWTNLRGKDPGYCPRTLEEFRALSPARQWMERMYRSWPGLLPLYLYTIWWPLEIRPNALHRIHIDKRGTFPLDRALVLAFPCLQLLALVALARSTGMDASGRTAALIGVGITIPFLTFTWLIGFATFQHHTHPRVLWYGNESEWNFYRAQVQSTVHVEFPRWIELLLNNIMEHTAHHVDTRVPLYKLTGAQHALEQRFGADDIVTERFTFAGMTRTLRACQLYDYESHQWLTFDGEPTSPARRVASGT